MKVLVLNCGSSSLKFQLMETSPEQIEANQDRLLANGSVTKIGSGDASIVFEAAGKRARDTAPVLTHKEAISAAF